MCVYGDVFIYVRCSDWGGGVCGNVCVWGGGGDGCCAFCLQVLVYGKYDCFVMQMFVFCVHPVAVLNAALCMTCSLFMLVEDVMGDHMEETHSRAGIICRLC